MKNTKIVWLCLLFLVTNFVLILAITSSRTQAQARNSTLRTAIQENYNETAGIYVVFTSPVGGESAWEIPHDFTNEEGGIIGRRLLKEVGEDYLYIEEIGQGATDRFWIPFSNIAFITSPKG